MAVRALIVDDGVFMRQMAKAILADMRRGVVGEAGRRVVRA